METKEAKKDDDLSSLVKVKLIDPLGKSIEGLKYQIRDGAKIVAQGTTDGTGAIKHFTSKIGAELEVYVERFASDELKKIRTIVPFMENFAVKLTSTKVKEKVKAVADKGAPGAYQRKTHKVKDGDTLGKIAAKNGTTAEAIARLNNMKLTDILHIDQILKMPVDKPATSGGAAPATNKQPPAEHKPAPTEQKPAPTESKSTPATTTPPASGNHPAEPITPPAPPTKADTGAQPIKVNDARGENGTPKTTANLVCDASGCIKVGDAGQLVEELNIRLLGFGNTIVPGKPWNEFTEKTAAAVKQFQRDYMGVPETGKVCGGVLAALDEMRTKFPVNIASMKCDCPGHKCSGFGNGHSDSAYASYFASPGHGHIGKEHPGMHRGMLWILRTVKYYVNHKDAALGYRFHGIAAGYRCWYHNKNKGRTSINHMGNALDLHFQKVNGSICTESQYESLRNQILIPRLHTQSGWVKNKISLEPRSIAPRWIHIDIRELRSTWMDARYYANTQGEADGMSMVDLAKSESRHKLVSCGGVPKKPAPVATDRIPAEQLTLSPKGLDFLKGWEKYKEMPYDDSHHYCTVGYGHLISGKKSCAVLKRANDPLYEKYSGGLKEPAAARLLAKDVASAIGVVQMHAQVPLYQREFDALVSLAFNCGGLSKFKNLLRNLNNKNYAGCCKEFADITNGGVKGLVDRRKAEMATFLHGTYDSSH